MENHFLHYARIFTRLFMHLQQFHFILRSISSSRTCGFIMPQSHFPEYPTWHQKYPRCDRGQGIPPLRPLSDEIQKGIILHRRQRHDKRKETQDPFAVDGHGVGAKLSAAVGEDVHEFQPFRGEKANGRIDHKQSRK